LPLEPYNLGECVLDSGIVALDKATIYKLYGYRRFPWRVVLALLATRRAGSCLERLVPTERLPTKAILRCFGEVGILKACVDMSWTALVLERQKWNWERIEDDVHGERRKGGAS
jgi:hypothetical protein